MIPVGIPTEFRWIPVYSGGQDKKCMIIHHVAKFKVPISIYVPKIPVDSGHQLGLSFRFRDVIV